jgi:hypothetical protein
MWITVHPLFEKPHTSMNSTCPTIQPPYKIWPVLFIEASGPSKVDDGWHTIAGQLKNLVTVFSIPRARDNDKRLPFNPHLASRDGIYLDSKLTSKFFIQISGGASCLNMHALLVIMQSVFIRGLGIRCSLLWRIIIFWSLILVPNPGFIHGTKLSY